MRIGILTQPLEDNYGGILQNWALQQILIQMGHDPLTLDYGLKYNWWRYFLSFSKSLLYNIKGQKRQFPHPPHHGRYCSKYSSDFIQNRIIKTTPVKDLEEKILVDYNLDCIIVGSDQVWRPCYNNRIENSFLEFAKDFPGRRIAYAASFGVDNWEFSDKQTKNCRQLAKKFYALSVREESGVQLCKNYLGVDSICVQDPTLLVSKESYELLCNSIQQQTDNYIAVYCIDITPERKLLINEVSQDLGIPIRYFSANKNVRLTVEEWLAMFRDAEYVITDSFHGTIFSIIFKKPFYTMANNERGRSRFESLLSKVGLTDRMSKNCIKTVIDWNQVYDSLYSLNHCSIQYLNNSLA